MPACLCVGQSEPSTPFAFLVAQLHNRRTGGEVRVIWVTNNNNDKSQEKRKAY